MDDLALLDSFLHRCNESANDVAGNKSYDQIRRWLRQKEKASAANSQARGDADEEPAVLLTFDVPLPGMNRDQQCDIALAPFARDNIPCLAPKGKVIVRAFTGGADAPCIHRVPNPGFWRAAGLVDALRSGTKSSHGKRRQRKREDICKRLSDCQYALPSRLNCRRFLTVPEQLTNRLGSMPAGRQQRSVVLNLRFRWPGDTACLGQKVDVLRGGALMLRDCEEDQTCTLQRKRISNFLRKLSSSMRLQRITPFAPSGL